MSKISKYLNQYLSGSVFSDENVLSAYSTDKSILSIKPQAVAVPADTNDLRKIVRFASQITKKGSKLSVTARGNGNDTTAAAIGGGLIVDLSKKMNNILEIDIKQRLVRVQPGITMRELNTALGLHGLTIPCSYAWSDHTLGGIIANNLHGQTDRDLDISQYISQAEVVLSNGDILQTSRLSKRELNRKKGLQNLEGEIYRRLDSLIDDRQDIIDEFLDSNPDNTGYELISEVKHKDGSFDILPLIFASQGTLGIVSEVIVRAQFVTRSTNYIAAIFPSSDLARDLIDYVLPLSPSQLDFYDFNLFRETEKLGKKLPFFTEKQLEKTSTFVLIGLNDSNQSARNKKIKKITKFLSKDVKHVVSDDENYNEFLNIEDIVSTYLNDSSKGYRVPLLKDFYLPTGFLGEFLGAVKSLEKQLSLKMPVFGSVLASTYSVRPGFNFNNISDRQLIFKSLKDISEILNPLEGNLTGGCPEGRLKSFFIYEEVNEQLLDMYKHIKEIFDIDNVLNPGVKQPVQFKDIVSNLRKSYDEPFIER